jgi:hypothetical protein
MHECLMDLPRNVREIVQQATNTSPSFGLSRRMLQ